MAKKKSTKRKPKALTKNPHTPSTEMLRKQVAAGRVRRNRIRQDILRGETHVRTLAGKYDVSIATIRKDMEHVYSKWAQADAQMYKSDQQRRQTRVQQLTSVLTKAVESFERSTEDKEKIVVHKVNKKCTVCNGRGINKKEEGCEACEAKGRITVVSETVESTGQAGDPSFLNVVRNCVKDIAQLEGLLSTRIEQSGTVTHDLLIHLVNEVENNDDANITEESIQNYAAGFIRQQEDQKLTVEGDVVKSNGSTKKKG